MIGGRGWGWSMKDVEGSQAIRNIFAHATGGQNDLGLKMTTGVLVENYVRYHWHEQPDLNPTGRPFPDPDRTIMTYDRTFGSGQGTIDAFMTEATAQCRENWRPQYTAQALVKYFQQGFGVWPGERNAATTTHFTAAGGDQIRWDNGEIGRRAICRLLVIRSTCTAMTSTTAAPSRLNVSNSASKARYAFTRGG